MKFALIAAIILATVMAFFAVQNSQQAHVTFMGWYFDGPLVIILLLSFGTGVLVSLLATIPGMVRKSMEISKLKSRISECSAKLEVLGKQSSDSHLQLEKGRVYENNIQKD